MSDPATPPAGDPNTDPAADPNTEPATPPADPASPPADPADPAADPAETEDARIKRANAQAARYRTELRETQAKLEEQGKTLAALAAVFNPEGNPQADPAQVAAEATQRVQSLESEASGLRAQLLVHELASDAGGNPVALLDSRRFTDKLITLDASAEDYRDQVTAAIKAAVESTPSLRAAGQAPSAGGAENAGQGAGSGAVVTQDQFNAMSYGQRAELFRTNPALYQQLADAAS